MGRKGAARKLKRVALVIGNGDYGDGSSLANPVNDAELMTETLERLGFDIIGGARDDEGDGADCDRAKLYGLINQLQEAVERGGTVLLYYAGHGIQIADENYMVPIGADLNADDPRLELVPIRRLVNLIANQAGPEGTVIVFLDACRNNPLPEGTMRSMADKVAASAVVVAPPGVSTRAVNVGSGMTTFKLPKRDTAARKFIALATAPGDVAYDGDPEKAFNSPFALALANNLETRGLDLDACYLRISSDVRDEVAKMGHVQEPWREVNLEVPFYMVPHSSWPILVLGSLGLVAGLIVSQVLFDNAGVAPIHTRPWIWALGMPFGVIAAIGTLNWGSRRPHDALFAFLGPVIGFILAVSLLYLVPPYPKTSTAVVDPAVAEVAVTMFTSVAIGSGLLFLIGTAITKFTSKVVRRTSALGLIDQAVHWSYPFLTTGSLLALIYFFVNSSPFHSTLAIHALAAGVIYATSAVIACKPQRAIFNGFGAFTGAIAVGILVAVLFAVFAVFTSAGDRAESLVLAVICTLWHGLLGAQLGYCFAYYVAEHER